jgi:amidase
MSDNIHYLSLLEVSDRIRRGETSSVAVTEALIDRIACVDSKLHSVQLLLAESALNEARKADSELAAGLWRGPLHGVPIGIKDNFSTKDSPTTCGVAARRNHQDDWDATVVERLRSAGAVLLAKLVMTEGAKFDHDPDLPRPANPWNADHWCGISSSGSGIAVAAGLVYAAVGMDSGGSIRMPTSANSVTGIKPSWGRISRYGVYACSPSYDVIGTFARSVADAAALLQSIAGSDDRDPTALLGSTPDYSSRLNADIRGRTLGIDWDYATGGGIDPEVVQAVHDAIATFEALGVRVREVKMPWNFDRALATLPSMVAELTASMAQNFPEISFGGLTGRGGEPLDPSDVVKAYQLRDIIKGEIDVQFQDVDFMIAPGVGEVLPTWDEVNEIGNDIERLLNRLCRFTTSFNLANVPTVSLPAGFSKSGLPIGIQIAGPRHGEVDLLCAAAAFQRASAHHTRRPPIDPD